MMRVLVAFVAALATMAGAASAASRHWTMTLAPAPNDFELAEIAFPHHGVSRETLRVAVHGLFGACAPCNPRPGYACRLGVTPDFCVKPASPARSRASH